MARILFTASSGRAATNWLAAFAELRSRGHDVRAVLFPIVPDPDHRGLDSLDFPAIARVAVPERLRTISADAVRQLATAAVASLQAFDPELVVATGCHAGPELGLLELLAGLDHRPVTAGCQHGFVQRWESYWRRFAFDHLLVFGDAFRRLAPASLVDRVQVAGLPKLDAITRSARPPLSLDSRPILFAAQTEFPTQLAAALAELGGMTGREVIIRPHPAYPVPDGILHSRLTVDVSAVPLPGQLEHVSLVVTTGSTVVLEAMAAGCPVVALPIQDGDLYTPAEIVASAITAAAISEVATRQQDVESQARIRRFLADTTGSADGGRAVVAADAIERVLPSRTTRGRQA
jgi:hypothetical protein